MMHLLFMDDLKVYAQGPKLWLEFEGRESRAIAPLCLPPGIHLTSQLRSEDCSMPRHFYVLSTIVYCRTVSLLGEGPIDKHALLHMHHCTLSQAEIHPWSFLYRMGDRCLMMKKKSTQIYRLTRDHQPHLINL